MSTINPEGIVKAVLQCSDKFFLDYSVSSPFRMSRFSNEVSHSCITDVTLSLFNTRFLRKYNIPCEKKNGLREVCFSAYRDSDMLLPTEIHLWNPGREFYHLRKARSTLALWCRKYIRLSEDCEFTPGESYIPTFGDVSIIGKLANKKHWTTTYNLVEETCELIYTTLSLKRQAKLHIGSVTKAERTELYRRHGGSGYRIFRELLLKYVLTIVDGARGSSVPKNNDTDRVINIEALFPVILQRQVAFGLKRVLRSANNSLDVKNVGGVLGLTYDAQEVHKRMISNRDYATVDFSNASNSVSVASVSAMFPKHVRDDLFLMRSHYVQFEDLTYSPNMLSSMGNGFTFEVMTCLLLAIGRVLDPTCRVFGDDVIIKNDVVDTFISCCQAIGFQVNKDKTFVNSPLRESCGAFYHDDYGYLTSYDLKRPANIAEAIAFTNKVLLLSQDDNNPVSPQLRVLHDSLVACYPTSMKGPITTEDDLSSWVFVRQAKRKHMKNDDQKSLFKRHINVLELLSLELCTPLSEWYMIKIPRFKQQHIRVVDGRSAYAAFLYSRRTTKRHRRGKGMWDLTLYLVSERGSRVSISDAYARIRT